MKIILRFPTTRAQAQPIDWPDDWPMPHVGEFIVLRDSSQFKVERVVYYAQGDIPWVQVSVT